MTMKSVQQTLLIALSLGIYQADAFFLDFLFPCSVIPTESGCFLGLFGRVMRSTSDPSSVECQETCALFPFLQFGYECGLCGAADDGTSASEKTQYTPDMADWSAFYRQTLHENNPNVLDHTPDGILWLKDGVDWKPWDGNVIDPTKLTPKEFYEQICVGGDTLPGLKELFYEINPFEDIYAPSKADVDEWHRIVLNHLRKIVGYDTYEAKPDHCNHIITLVSQERKYTDKWDEKYPDETCGPGSDPHCGDTFRLLLEDQQPYLPEGHPGCPEINTGAENAARGQISSVQTDVPWSVNFLRGFCGFLGSEGFWGGHVGPFFHREYFGCSFWEANPDNPTSGAARLDCRWSGEIYPNLYEEP